MQTKVFARGWSTATLTRFSVEIKRGLRVVSRSDKKYIAEKMQPPEDDEGMSPWLILGIFLVIFIVLCHLLYILR